MNKDTDNEYPELNKEGQDAAQEAIDRVREGMKKACLNVIEEEISYIYTDIAKYVESDSWDNFRQSVIQFVSGYTGLSEYESRPIRNRILMENRDQLILDLNQDLIRKNKDLEEKVNYLINNHNRTY